eukprot:5782332-Alexandrium_andersonii.AAC.1
MLPRDSWPKLGMNGDWNCSEALAEPAVAEEGGVRDRGRAAEEVLGLGGGALHAASGLLGAAT